MNYEIAFNAMIKYLETSIESDMNLFKKYENRNDSMANSFASRYSESYAALSYAKSLKNLIEI